VLVEIVAGAGRCGIEAGVPAARLAKLIDELPGLTFGGLQAYHGTAQHLRTLAERKTAVGGIVDKVNRTRAALQRLGLPCPEVTGGGTGTYRLEMESGVYTELQCGSYIFMDADYGRNQDEEGNPYRRFGQSLFVYTTVMSRPNRERAVVDAGLKAISVDSGPPLVHNQPDLEYVFKGDEHGQIRLPEIGHSLRLGNKLLLVPGHCDPTVNLYDHFVGVRDGWVEAVWPIVGRGPGR
jgi:3-hydroxy-D-aspartate aldolase